MSIRACRNWGKSLGESGYMLAQWAVPVRKLPFVIIQIRLYGQDLGEGRTTLDVNDFVVSEGVSCIGQTKGVPRVNGSIDEDDFGDFNVLPSVVCIRPGDSTFDKIPIIS